MQKSRVINMQKMENQQLEGLTWAPLSHSCTTISPSNLPSDIFDIAMEEDLNWIREHETFHILQTDIIVC